MNASTTEQAVDTSNSGNLDLSLTATIAQESNHSASSTLATQSSKSSDSASKSLDNHANRINESKVDAPKLRQRAAKRLRSKSSYGTRDVRLRLSPPRMEQLDHPRRGRLDRISIPVHRYNYGMVYCSVCKKQFRQDLPIECYAGNIICSFECFHKPF